MASRGQVEKISHIGILVSNLEEAKRLFAGLLGTEFTDLGEFAHLDVRSAIEPSGIELVEPLTPDGWVAKILQQRGEGLVTLSLKVTDIEEAVAETKSKGIRVVRRMEIGKIKAAVLHPEDTRGVTIELIQYEAKHPIVALQ